MQVLIELTEKVTGPEVKGSAGYLQPAQARWRVYGSGALGRLYTDVLVEGPSRTGRWRGAAHFPLGEHPHWLTPPAGLTAARRLAKQMVTQ